MLKFSKARYFISDFEIQKKRKDLNDPLRLNKKCGYLLSNTSGVFKAPADTTTHLALTTTKIKFKDGREAMSTHALNQLDKYSDTLGIFYALL